ncbi:MAG: transcription elongation factor GreA [Actinomycetota bacterium]
MSEQPEQIVVSAETLDRMRAELEELTTVGRKAMSERLLRAREFGDIRENADYDAAKDAQAMMEARIRRLQYMTKHAAIRDAPAETEEVTPGVIVTICEIGQDETEEYLLAATAEEKLPGVRTITTASPLGSALLGKRVGDSIVVEAPAGAFSVKLVGLRPAGA